MVNESTRVQRAKAIFGNAQEISDLAEETAYLDVACAGDIELREEVERLLAAADGAGDFMAAPAVAPLPAADNESLTEGPGTVIGPYRLMEQIGEGGFGLVFVAEQQRPVRRQVALKIIKPGMDTRQVIARFEAERQALALMDHPNIAKVFDAGATSSGRPYFVMELVRGVSITQYCDEHLLTLRERLELFITLCHAIQHAHQKGIIHRDVKPTNVLVTLYDGRPVPKVIDFGVAKALSQQLTERTIYTQLAQMIGTPLYMSPEQTEMNGLDIDTRSDIYSLGVVLYELLTGTTPFEWERLKQAAADEIRRIVREEDPPTPSARISSLCRRSPPRPDEAAAGDRESGDRLAMTAAQRRIEPARLTKLVRGELDWIVMKALEKERNHRYETANALAADVEHYLRDEPVEACPPSALYRFGKFSRRNKAGLGVAALVLCFLTVLGTGLGWTMRDHLARQARITGQLELILDEVARLEQAEKWSEALVSAQRAEAALAAGEATPQIQERARQAIADLEFVRRLEEVRMQYGSVWNRNSPDSAPSVRADQDYMAAFCEAGMDIDAMPVNEAVDRLTRHQAIAAATIPALDEWATARSRTEDKAGLCRLIDVLHAADPDPWRQRVREAMARKDQSAVADLVTSADLDRQPAATLTLLAFWASGTEREPQLVLRTAQWKHPADYWINLRLGVNLVYQESRNVARDGIGFLRAAVALRPESAHAIMLLGVGYRRLGQYDQAIACYRKAIELNPNSFSSFSNLSSALILKGLYDEAIAALEQSIKLTSTTGAYAELSIIHSSCPDTRLRNPRRATELAEKAVELEPHASNNWTALGIARYRQGQWQEARTAFAKSLQLGTDSLGGTFKWTDAIDWFFLAMTDWQLGHNGQARQCYERALQEMEKGLTWQDDVEQLRRFHEEAQQLMGLPGLSPKVRSALLLKALSEEIEQAPTDPTRWIDRGRLYAEAQSWDEAAADFAEALDRAQDTDHWTSPRKRIGRELAGQPELFERVTKLRPNESTLWIGRGQYRAQQSHWAEAASDYARAFQTRSIADETIFEYAGALLLADDQEGYERICTELAARAAEPHDTTAAYVTAHTCGIGVANSVEPAQLAAWAAERLEEDTMPWALHVMGLVQYRAGRFDLAIEHLEKSNAGSWAELCKAQNWLVLAMAHQRLNGAEAACEWLSRAQEAMERAKPKSPVDAVAVEPVDWIGLVALRREAEALIGKNGTRQAEEEIKPSN